MWVKLSIACALLRREMFTLRGLEDGRTSVHEKTRLVIDNKTRNWNRQTNRQRRQRDWEGETETAVEGEKFIYIRQKAWAVSRGYWGPVVTDYRVNPHIGVPATGVLGSQVSRTIMQNGVLRLQTCAQCVYHYVPTVSVNMYTVSTNITFCIHIMQCMYKGVHNVYTNNVCTYVYT